MLALLAPGVAVVVGLGCEGPRPAGLLVDALIVDATDQVCPQPALASLAWFVCMVDPAGCSRGEAGVDDDGDGVAEIAGDCDDSERYVGPAAIEVCDGRDDDCDGLVDEDAVCPDPARVCPISFAAARCCGARASIAGTFLEPFPSEDGGVAMTSGWSTPWEVVIRRRDTGERRRAVVCPAPPVTAEGYPFRFLLADEQFVVAGADYEIVLNLRWYMNASLGPTAVCSRRVPVVRTAPDLASACLDIGEATPWCL